MITLGRQTACSTQHKRATLISGLHPKGLSWSSQDIIASGCAYYSNAKIMSMQQANMVDGLTNFSEGEFLEEHTGNFQFFISVTEGRSPFLGRQVPRKRVPGAVLIPQHRGCRRRRREVAAEAIDLFQGSLVLCSRSKHNVRAT
jgi:hypothetical protein